MNKTKLYFTFFVLLIIACSGNDDLNETCNPIFTFSDSTPANFDNIASRIFDPYCAPCHSTTAWESGNVRDGYLPLDFEMKKHQSNLILQNLFDKYISNYNNPESSILIRVLFEDAVVRTTGSDLITEREPRNSCFLPSDYTNAIKKWIKQSGSAQNLFN
jgi:hypothetical protein